MAHASRSTIRKKLSHDDKTREKIRTSQIINRLEKHIFGEVELTTSQVQAAKVLLGKTLPDLAQTQLTGKDGESLVPPDLSVYIKAREKVVKDV